jgi:Cdc6-like AAA superfamily ATPase
VPGILQGMSILVLDELDQACKQSDEAAQAIFALAALPSSRLIVIGIANRMDLAHRVLKPSSRSSLGPTTDTALAAPSQGQHLVVPFHSYNAKQLLELLQVSDVGSCLLDSNDTAVASCSGLDVHGAL